MAGRFMLRVAWSNSGVCEHFSLAGFFSVYSWIDTRGRVEALKVGESVEIDVDGGTLTVDRLS